jgi:hypothetical protein
MDQGIYQEGFPTDLDKLDIAYRYITKKVIADVFRGREVDPCIIALPQETSLQPLHTLLNQVSMPGLQEALSHNLRYAMYVHHFEQEGRRSYRVSPGLAEKLNNTLLKGLKCSDLRLPYKAIYIEASDNLAFRLWNEMSEWHEFEGAYLCVGPSYLPPFGRATVDEIEKLHEKVRALHVLLTGKPKSDILMDDATFNFSIRLPDDADLDEQLQEVDRLDLKGEAGENSSWHHIMQWLVNVVIYSTWSDCERDHLWVDPQAQSLWQKLKKAKGKKASRLQKQLDGCKQTRYYLLGKSIKIDRTALGTGRKGAKGTKLTVQFRVAGHWRKQPHGPGRKERKLIWIDPFWKGPKDSPIREAIHTLGK